MLQLSNFVRHSHRMLSHPLSSLPLLHSTSNKMFSKRFIASSSNILSTKHASFNKPTFVTHSILSHRGFMHLSNAKLGHNLEDYYGLGEFATGIHSPMVDYIWWGWFALQVVIIFGALFHSNYYFSGRILPKNQGNTQLTEDSW